MHDILGGSAASVLGITFGLSYALLIFAGPLAPYLSYGVAATFVSSAVLATFPPIEQMVNAEGCVALKAGTKEPLQS